MNKTIPHLRECADLLTVEAHAGFVDVTQLDLPGSELAGTGSPDFAQQEGLYPNPASPRSGYDFQQGPKVSRCCTPGISQLSPFSAQGHIIWDPEMRPSSYCPVGDRLAEGQDLAALGFCPTLCRIMTGYRNMSPSC